MCKIELVYMRYVLFKRRHFWIFDKGNTSYVSFCPECVALHDGIVV